MRRSIVLFCLGFPVGAFSGWILTNAFDLDPSSWRALFGARSILCIALPLFCALSILRGVEKKSLPVLVALAVATALTIFTGLDSAIDFVRGAQWQKAEVVGAGGFTFRAITTNVDVPDVYVKLGDGRVLTRSKAAKHVHGGAIELLVLPASEIILDARG